ncbi:MAG: hypothetical protein WCR80_00030 [Bacilli bacterium]
MKVEIQLGVYLLKIVDGKAKPSSLTKSRKLALNVVKEYITGLCESDIMKLDGTIMVM